jgi:hypothetical protein
MRRGEAEMHVAAGENGRSGGAAAQRNYFCGRVFTPVWLPQFLLLVTGLEGFALLSD